MTVCSIRELQGNRQFLQCLYLLRSNVCLWACFSIVWIEAFWEDNVPRPKEKCFPRTEFGSSIGSCLLDTVAWFRE